MLWRPQINTSMDTMSSSDSADNADKPRAGCIGLGRLGWQLAANLIASGFTVSGYRRRARAEFGEFGGRPAASVTELAASSDVIVTCLPDEQALDEVVGGLVVAARAGQVVLEVSTLSIAEKERQRDRLAEAGVAMLDCPLSGNPDFVRTRQAVAFVSGDLEAMARARPVIAGFTDHAVELGAFGNGSRMKYLANMLVAVHCMAAAEVFNAGARVGLTPEAIAEALNMGAAASRQLAIRAPVVSGAKAGQQRGSANTQHSEFPTIAEFLRGLGAAAPLFETAAEHYEAGLAAGFGGLDTSMVYTGILRSKSTPNPATPPVKPAGT